MMKHQKNKHAGRKGPSLREERSAGSLPPLAAPATRALKNGGIRTLKQLSKFSEPEILALHGMGPGSMVRLREAMTAAGLGFKNDAEKKSSKHQ